MHKLLFACFLVSIMLIGCVGSYYSYKIEHHQDEFDGFTIDRMSGGYLYDNALNLKNSVWINPQRYQSKAGNVSFQLMADLWDTEWLYLGPEESLVLLVDGQRIAFSGEGSAKYRDVTTGVQGAVIKERAFYQVTPSQLRAIASAQEVKVKLQGSTRFVTRAFAKENVQNFKRFVTEFVDKQ